MKPKTVHYLQAYKENGDPFTLCVGARIWQKISEIRAKIKRSPFAEMMIKKLNRKYYD